MSGLIVPLGEWILRQACRQVRAWTEAGWQFRVAVNLSAMQLRQPDFASLIERILDDSGLIASALELEVTESVFLDPSKVAITNTLHEVAEMGVCLAIDDFGTGYSSLGYLKRFPFNRIKIDASFVRDIGAKASADAIVKAIIALGRSLGKASPPKVWKQASSSPSSATTPAMRCKATCSLNRCPRPRSNEYSQAKRRSSRS
jgi:EAL domain-containing protein (putative c-di-GMP-specific phosphodiesterase class I)